MPWERASEAPPGVRDLSEHERQVWAKVYDERRSAGLSKAEAAKRAWGAVHRLKKAGARLVVRTERLPVVLMRKAQRPPAPPQEDQEEPQEEQEPEVGGRVHFRHPGSGERRVGQLKSRGERGAYVVDHETGEGHRVEHGHYMHHDDPASPSDGDEVEPERDDAGDDELPDYVEHDLGLGPRTTEGVLATMAMVDRLAHPRDVAVLSRDDVVVKGKRAAVEGTVIDDARVVRVLEVLLQQPGEALWQARGPRGMVGLGRDELDLYLSPPEE